MPGKTCHDVSGDKNIDWQLADGKGGSSFGILNKLTTAPTRTLIGRRCKPFAPENKDAAVEYFGRRGPPRSVDPKKGGCGFCGFNSRLPISSIDPPTTLENGLKPWPPVWVTASEKHILTLFEDAFGAGIDYAQLAKIYGSEQLVTSYFEPAGFLESLSGR